MGRSACVVAFDLVTSTKNMIGSLSLKVLQHILAYHAVKLYPNLKFFRLIFVVELLEMVETRFSIVICQAIAVIVVGCLTLRVLPAIFCRCADSGNVSAARYWVYWADIFLF